VLLTYSSTGAFRLLSASFSRFSGISSVEKTHSLNEDNSFVRPPPEGYCSKLFDPVRIVSGLVSNCI